MSKLIDIENLKKSLSTVKTWILSKILPSLGGDNINDLLESGVYPWCSLGRPNNIATGSNHWTLIVSRSTSPDFNGFYTVEQTAYGREGDSGKVAKRVVFVKEDGTKDFDSAGGWINCTRGANIISFNGFVECNTITQTQIDTIFSSLRNYEQQWYLAGDSSKRVTGGTVTFSDALAKLVHPEDSRGVAANLGDFILFAKDGEGRNICRLVPVNDAKAPTDSFPGTYGILTPNDRMDIDNALMGTYGEGNMNEALTAGFYPYCTTGRPEGCNDSDWFTCITHRSRQVDGNGFFSVYQTCVGRSSTGALKGKIFQRLIFYKPSNRAEDNYGEWCEVNKDYSEDIMSSIAGSLYYYKKISTIEIDRGTGLSVSAPGGGSTTYSNRLFEVYSGDGEDYIKNFRIELNLLEKVSGITADSIIKVRAFYRKGNSQQGFTTYQGESHARMYVGNSSNVATVRALSSLSYPFRDEEKGWQDLVLAEEVITEGYANHFIKIGNWSHSNPALLTIEGSFKVPSSWFVLGWIEIWSPREGITITMNDHYTPTSGTTFQTTQSNGFVVTGDPIICSIETDAKGHITKILEARNNFADAGAVVFANRDFTSSNVLIGAGAKNEAMDSGKSIETTLSSNDDNKIPTSKAVATYLGQYGPDHLVVNSTDVGSSAVNGASENGKTRIVMAPKTGNLYDVGVTIQGSGAASVTSDANKVITINATNTTYSTQAVSSTTAGLLSYAQNRKITAENSVSTATTVSSISTQYGTYIVTPSSGTTAQTLGCSAYTYGPTVAKIDVIIDNSGNSKDLTITIPSTTTYVRCDGVTSLKISAGKIGEINIIYANSKFYTRTVS